MAPLLIHFLGLLAIGTVAIAAPANPILSVTSHSERATTTKLSQNSVVTATGTAAGTATGTAAGTLIASPSSTGKITIPLNRINSAPIQNNLAGDQSAGAIPGGTDNSTLTQVRPDLQTYVNSASLITGNTTANSKRSIPSTLGLDTPNPADCAGSQLPFLSFAQSTWNAVAARICTTWYPNPASFEYDPSAPLPSALQSSTLGPFSIGVGLPIVTFTVSYGVNDWDTQANGWQTFYVPQSQAICLADLTILINDMFDVCLFPTGYDTSLDFTGTRNPKWYTFTVTSP